MPAVGPLWVASLGAKSSNSAGVCGRALEHKRTVIDFWPLRVLSLALHKQCGSLVCLQGWYFWCLWLFWFCTTMEKGVAAGPGEGGVADVCTTPNNRNRQKCKQAYGCSHRIAKVCCCIISGSSGFLVLNN